MILFPQILARRYACHLFEEASEMMGKIEAKKLPQIGHNRWDSLFSESSSWRRKDRKNMQKQSKNGTFLHVNYIFSAKLVKIQPIYVIPI